MDKMPELELSESFRQAFRSHPAGVALITACISGHPVGLTVSSVASASTNPVALTFSLTRKKGTAGALLSAGTFLVQFLGAQHQKIAEQFAASGGKHFTEEQGWMSLDSGEPLLPDTRAALRCRPLKVVPVGESSVVIAKVLSVSNGLPGAPLIYLDRAFL